MDPTAIPPYRVVRAGANRVILADFVLVGWRENGKCYLLASTAVDDATLTFAQRRQRFEFVDAEHLRTAGIKMARHVEADVLDYVVIEAATFAECLAGLLFGQLWRPDTIRAVGSAGMGRRAGPRVQPDPVVLCGHQPRGLTVMRCTEPAGHYPATPHAHTIEWDEEPEHPAIEGSESTP